MQLSLQNFTAMVEQMAAAVQGAAIQTLDLAVGSVLRAVLEANASLGLWLQWLIVQVLQTTRLATSSGADCDSFGADFGFTRLPAATAGGIVSFGRFAPVLSAFVPVGAVVMTSDGSQSFAVTADPTNPAYSANLGGYTLAAGIASIDLPVEANIAGAAGNVLAGTVGLMASAIPGIDTVSNATPLTGGFDAESDAAFKARFGNYLASLSRATMGAIEAAVTGVEQGLSVAISENIDQTGAASLGNFVVTIDNGTGAPPASLLATVQQAVDTVRPVGTRFAVQGPVVALADVSLTLTLVQNAVSQTVIGAVTDVIGAYIASLPVGATLPHSKLAQLSYDASSAVINVTGTLLNGGVADLVPPLFGVVRAGTISVT
ncbi:baseplate J/gp47 family protein [Acidiphilium sp. AL]|uniref:Baseplate J/gp47 family protein n=1 Tax=Acidiphilium iwatense TaxID=768198 RepID=A0ABS9DRE7_9PROT|nr:MULTISPECIES: baseplate J/gp47 family protein [Acidiphilium]MCF3945313.1 baseplate J/gp47 family protein [Acidiphilium iwatense]MCU4159393.1 baseplate J/gp47 family protein [Acidiphilium sp. AL]